MYKDACKIRSVSLLHIIKIYNNPLSETGGYYFKSIQ
jgi:hypothetical protein